MPAATPLRIAWMGSTPLETGGAPGVALELIDGLGKLGHRIDCFLPGSGAKVPARLVENDNVEFVWGRGGWRWGRWYSRTQIAAFVTGLFSRGLVSLRLRRAVARRHSQAPYDVLFQASSIESLSVPARLLRTVPLVIRPDSHQAGELRWLLAERRLALRCQPPSIFLIVAAVMTLRSFIQRFTVQRARLLICLSSVFRDHIVRDYGFPADRTVVVTNPVNLERFTADSRPLQDPPVVLVPGRVSVRKGIEDVVAVARLMSDRGDEARVRVVGGPSLWSDYTKLLEDLPASSEHVRKVPPAEMPGEFARADVMLQASKYDPCPMAVIEALASGVPIVGTAEVGSIEGVDPEVAIVVEPGDVDGLAAGIETMLERMRRDPERMRSLARAEAERRFAPSVVCRQISDALQALARASGPSPREHRTSHARERAPV